MQYKPWAKEAKRKKRVDKYEEAAIKKNANPKENLLKLKKKKKESCQERSG
jgi:hypothetical protein